MINRNKFFDYIKPLFVSYDQGQVDGINVLLNEWETRRLADLRWLAYPFATTFHETNETMQPVREAYWLSEEWREKNLSYYPYYGRGYVQLTHKENYAKYNIEDDPDKAMEPELAAFILFDGMINAKFTKYKLADYFNERITDAYEARRIVNGLDKASKIRGYYDKFLRALQTAEEVV